jgi:hypothetical protein
MTLPVPFAGVCRYDDAWLELSLYLERTRATHGAAPSAQPTGAAEGAPASAALREQVELLVEKVRLQLELAPGPS